jgi:outer membrane protein TolC
MLGPNSLANEVLLTQPIWTGGKIHNRFKQAGLGVQAAHASVTRSQQQTVFEVTNAYLNVQLAHELEVVVADSIGHFRAIEDLIQALINQGDEYVTITDLSRVRTVRSLAEVDHVRATQSSLLASAALWQAMGIEQSMLVPFEVPELTPQSESVDLARVLSDALRQRPELIQTRLAIKNAELERKVAKAQYAPDFGLFARAYTISDDGGYLNPNHQQREQWTIGLSASVPLLTGGRRSAEWRKADAQHLQAMQTERFVRSLITLELQKFYLEYTEASQSLPAALDAKNQAEATLEGYRQQFLGDQIRDAEMPEYFEDLVNSRALLTLAKARYYQSVLQLNLALAKIRLASASNEYFVAAVESGSAHLPANPPVAGPNASSRPAAQSPDVFQSVGRGS